MDNLQWFKFSPSDWMMGRIQRQPPQVQVDFLRLCCKYWQKDGVVSVEDAEIEAMDSYDTLVKYKVVKVEDDSIVIDFLDEQLESLEGKRKQASEAGKRSAAARKRKKETNDRSTTVDKPLNEKEQSREEENREEETILETDFDLFFMAYGKKVDLIPCQREWSNIDKAEHQKILKHVPKYVSAIHDKKYLKSPLKYLKDRTWLDEDLPNAKPKTERFIPTPPKIY